MEKIYVKNNKEGLEFLFKVMSLFKNDCIGKSVMDMLVHVGDDSVQFAVC